MYQREWTAQTDNSSKVRRTISHPDEAPESTANSLGRKSPHLSMHADERWLHLPTFYQMQNAWWYWFHVLGGPGHPTAEGEYLVP